MRHAHTSPTQSTTVTVMDDATQHLKSVLAAIADLTANIPTPEDTAPATVPLDDARTQLGRLAQAAKERHERIALTGPDGKASAVLVHPDDWADLVDALALAQNAIERAAGIAPDPIPHEEVMAALDEAAKNAQDAA